jgi:hypothetical protein
MLFREDIGNYLTMLRSNKVLLSFAATSTAGFVGISPKGRGKDAARRQEGRKPYLPTPDETEERRLSGNRAAFSLDTFFWRRKRKYLAFGCEYPINSSSR